MTVVDTDVLIDALRGRPDARRRIDAGLQTGALATTSVSAFELRSGARSDRAVETVETLLGALTVLPFDQEAAERAAEVRRTLEAEGEGIAMADYLIAGICLSRSGLLLTRNREHVGRVPGLSLGTLPGSG